MILSLGLRWRPVHDGSEQATTVEPVDPVEVRVRQVFQAKPRPVSGDELILVGSRGDRQLLADRLDPRSGLALAVGLRRGEIRGCVAQDLTCPFQVGEVVASEGLSVSGR